VPGALENYLQLTGFWLMCKWTRYIGSCPLTHPKRRPTLSTITLA